MTYSIRKQKTYAQHCDNYVNSVSTAIGSLLTSSKTKMSMHSKTSPTSEPTLPTLVCCTFIYIYSNLIVPERGSVIASVCYLLYSGIVL